MAFENFVSKSLCLCSSEQNFKTHEAKLRELPRKIEKSRIKVGDFKNVSINRTSFEEIKDMEDLNIINVDTHRTFHPTTAKYTIFSSTNGTFAKTDHILGY